MPGGQPSTIAPRRAEQAAASKPANRGARGRAEPIRGFRPDIQGLRAVAVLVVVLYHAGVPVVSGGFVGVDLFFVISGFLITSLLVRERLATGTISLPAFWARRVRRILPAATTVLIATAVASALILPRAVRTAVGYDIAAAALSVANWRFAWQTTDYLAQDRDPSPVLHYWSLGVEEQFYLVWPLLVLVVALGVAVGRRLSTRIVRARLLVACSAIVVTSLVLCVMTTRTSQPYAFFGSPSRAWQLALGALVAIAVPLLAHLRGPVRAMVGWAGALGLGLAVVALSEGSGQALAYPGWVALLPTLAGVALIAAGTGGPIPGLDRFLAGPAMQRVGDLSYSWYLWHWPALVFADVLLGGNPWWGRAIAVAGSFALAWATFRWIETPWRYPSQAIRRPRVSLTIGAVLVVTSLIAAAATVVTARLEGPVAVEAETGELVRLRPDPAVAASDVFSLRTRGCDLGFEESDFRECFFGTATSQVHIALLGDSHAVHLFSGLLAAVDERSWRLQAVTKSACTPADVSRWNSERGRVFTECDTWRAAMLARMTDDPPDVVVISAAFTPSIEIVDRKTHRRLRGDAAVQAWIEGMRRTVERFTRAGSQVVLLRDVPAAQFDVPSCIETTRNAPACSVPQSARIPEQAVVKGVPGAAFADFTPRFCTAGRCSAVVGDVLVYRDRSHITRTFSLTLSDFFLAQLDAALAR